MRAVHGEVSHHLATPELTLDVTARGGHLAPVVFHLPERDVAPYVLAPWEPAEFPDDDLVMIANVPATAARPFAWSAVTLDGYVWFALKNPADFPATLLWISNGGRSGPPWNGRHLGRIGIEEVCSYFSHGVNVSRQDLLAAHGIPTSRRFTREETVSLRTIQGVALVPDDFGAVREILPKGQGELVISGESGREIVVALNWPFVV